MIIRIYQQRGVFESQMSFGAPGRVCFDGNKRTIRPRLHPPRPAVRIDNDLLSCASVSDAPRDRIDSLSSTLRRRRNLGELDRWTRAGLMRLAPVQHHTENQ